MVRVINILLALCNFFIFIVWIFFELKVSTYIKRLQIEIGELEKENKALTENLDSQIFEVTKLINIPQLRHFAIQQGFTERND